MSLLSSHAIDEFQRLWHARFGVELPREDAVARAHQIYALVQMLVEVDSGQDSDGEASLAEIVASAIELLPTQTQRPPQ